MLFWVISNLVAEYQYTLGFLAVNWMITVWGKGLESKRCRPWASSSYCESLYKSARITQQRPSACFQAELKQKNHNEDQRGKENKSIKFRKRTKRLRHFIGKDSKLKTQATTKAKRDQTEAGLPRCGHAGTIKQGVKAPRWLQGEGGWRSMQRSCWSMRACEQLSVGLHSVKKVRGEE